jgi:hypothetical protein
MKPSEAKTCPVSTSLVMWLGGTPAARATSAAV